MDEFRITQQIKKMDSLFDTVSIHIVEALADLKLEWDALISKKFNQEIERKADNVKRLLEAALAENKKLQEKMSLSQGDTDAFERIEKEEENS
jgi:hypothetical protein